MNAHSGQQWCSEFEQHPAICPPLMVAGLPPPPIPRAAQALQSRGGGGEGGGPGLGSHYHSDV